MKTMKKLIAIGTLLCICKFSNAQVSESGLLVDSLNRSALFMQVDVPEDDVKDALDAYFKKLNIEKEKGKGFIIKKSLPFITYKRAAVDSMAGQALDYYFKVDTRKQKGPDLTTIYVAASSGYNNFISPQAADQWTNFKKFAEFLRTNYFEQHRINKNLESLTKELTKASNKLKDLEEEKQKLQNTISEKTTLITGLQAQLSKLKPDPVKQ